MSSYEPDLLGLWGPPEPTPGQKANQSLLDASRAYAVSSWAKNAAKPTAFDIEYYPKLKDRHDKILAEQLAAADQDPKNEFADAKAIAEQAARATKLRFQQDYRIPDITARLEQAKRDHENNAKLYDPLKQDMPPHDAENRMMAGQPVVASISADDGKGKVLSGAELEEMDRKGRWEEAGKTNTWVVGPPRAGQLVGEAMAQGYRTVEGGVMGAKYAMDQGEPFFVEKSRPPTMVDEVGRAIFHTGTATDPVKFTRINPKVLDEMSKGAKEMRETRGESVKYSIPGHVQTIVTQALEKYGADAYDQAKLEDPQGEPHTWQKRAIELALDKEYPVTGPEPWEPIDNPDYVYWPSKQDFINGVKKTVLKHPNAAQFLFNTVLDPANLLPLARVAGKAAGKATGITNKAANLIENIGDRKVFGKTIGDIVTNNYMANKVERRLGAEAAAGVEAAISGAAKYEVDQDLAAMQRLIDRGRELTKTPTDDKLLWEALHGNISTDVLSPELKEAYAIAHQLRSVNHPLFMEKYGQHRWNKQGLLDSAYLDDTEFGAPHVLRDGETVEEGLARRLERDEGQIASGSGLKRASSGGTKHRTSATDISADEAPPPDWNTNVWDQWQARLTEEGNPTVHANKLRQVDQSIGGEDKLVHTLKTKDLDVYTAGRPDMVPVDAIVGDVWQKATGKVGQYKKGEYTTLVHRSMLPHFATLVRSAGPLETDKAIKTALDGISYVNKKWAQLQTTLSGAKFAEKQMSGNLLYAMLGQGWDTLNIPLQARAWKLAAKHQAGRADDLLELAYKSGLLSPDESWLGMSAKPNTSAVQKLDQALGFINDKTKVVKAVQKWGTFSDVQTKLATWLHFMPENATLEQAKVAARKAHDFTVNFARLGEAGKLAGHFIPFSGWMEFEAKRKLMSIFTQTERFMPYLKAQESYSRSNASVAPYAVQPMNMMNRGAMIAPWDSQPPEQQARANKAIEAAFQAWKNAGSPTYEDDKGTREMTKLVMDHPFAIGFPILSKLGGGNDDFTMKNAYAPINYLYEVITKETADDGKELPDRTITPLRRMGQSYFKRHIDAIDAVRKVLSDDPEAQARFAIQVMAANFIGTAGSTLINTVAGRQMLPVGRPGTSQRVYSPDIEAVRNATNEAIDIHEMQKTDAASRQW